MVLFLTSGLAKDQTLKMRRVEAAVGGVTPRVCLSAGRLLCVFVVGGWREARSKSPRRSVAGCRPMTELCCEPLWCRAVIGCWLTCGRVVSVLDVVCGCCDFSTLMFSSICCGSPYSSAAESSPSQTLLRVRSRPESSGSYSVHELNSTLTTKEPDPGLG